MKCVILVSLAIGAVAIQSAGTPGGQNDLRGRWDGTGSRKVQRRKTGTSSFKQQHTHRKRAVHRTIHQESGPEEVAQPERGGWPLHFDAHKPFLITPLVQEMQKSGKSVHDIRMFVKEKSRALIKSAAASGTQAVDMGFSGFFSTPSVSKERMDHFWFWYQPCIECKDVASAALIQWIQGGPGGSGTHGANDEIGQFYVDGQGKIHPRPYSWCRKNSCLFVDSPTQTGFSYQTDLHYNYVGDKNVEWATSSQEVAGQLVEVLKQFLYIFPEHESSPFHISGQSYAGIYCPHFAKAVLDAKDLNIQLKGVHVGNPCLDMRVQIPTYPETLYRLTEAFLMIGLKKEAVKTS